MLIELSDSRSHRRAATIVVLSLIKPQCQGDGRRKRCGGPPLSTHLSRLREPSRYGRNGHRKRVAAAMKKSEQVRPGDPTNASRRAPPSRTCCSTAHPSKSGRRAKQERSFRGETPPTFLRIFRDLFGGIAARRENHGKNAEFRAIRNVRTPHDARDLANSNSLSSARRGCVPPSAGGLSFRFFQKRRALEVCNVAFWIRQALEYHASGLSNDCIWSLGRTESPAPRSPRTTPITVFSPKK